MQYVPMRFMTNFPKGSSRYGATNTDPVYVLALGIEEGQIVNALVQYRRYNGSSSPLGLWTQITEILPISDLGELRA